jgi:hypothetical protein
VMAVGAWVDSKAARNQRTRWAARQLMAAGCGPLRTPACDRRTPPGDWTCFDGEVHARRPAPRRGQDKCGAI